MRRAVPVAVTAAVVGLSGAACAAAAPATDQLSASHSAMALPGPDKSQGVAGRGVAGRWPAYSARVHRVTRRELGTSWHSGCPVRASGLRAVTLRYAGFDHRAHRGTLVVATGAVPAIERALHTLYHHRFPIRRMRPIAVYGGSDNRSMRHDNTSAFNCRYAVADGPKQWSAHAYGDAIDIDPVENPYVLDGRVRPAKGKRYAERRRHRPGMITPGSVAVRAFAAVGWPWGGRWTSSPDWQHFSSTGG